MRRALLFAVVIAACGPQTLEPQPQPQPQQQQTPQQQQPVLTGLPCDVRAALQSNCAGCHNGTQYIPTFKTRDDLLSLGAEVGVRLVSTEVPMPPRGAERQLTEAERALISRWVEQGMPAGECGGLQ